MVCSKYHLPEDTPNVPNREFPDEVPPDTVRLPFNTTAFVSPLSGLTVQ